MKASLLLYLWHIASKIWQDSKSNKMGASYSWEAGTFGSKKFESPKSYCVKSYLALYTHTAVNHLSVRRHHPPTICDWMKAPESDRDWPRISLHLFTFDQCYKLTQKQNKIQGATYHQSFFYWSDKVCAMFPTFPHVYFGPSMFFLFGS